MKNVSFSQIVTGATPVASAFDSHGAARMWWRVILWLHGKPTSPTISENERCQTVAAGFRFYAQLYRFLGAFFWLVGGACWGVGIFESKSDALYWTLSSALAGAFLWFASSLGFSGARALKAGSRDARLILCAFMVAIIAFLSGLTAALSVAAQFATQNHVALNLTALVVVWTFGIGSYLIEVLYLVSDRKHGKFGL